jgi:hypothetical protein
MFLMDSIIEAHRLLTNLPTDLQTREPFLPAVYASLTERLRGTPRFLLDENATRVMVELTLGRPKVLREALRHFRIPYPAMWIEWPEAARDTLRQAFGGAHFTPDRPLPQRLGFLIETDDSGRRGAVQWLWTASDMPQDLPIPNIAPIGPYFDLDGDFEQPVTQLLGLLDANLCKLWRTNEIQTDALLGIWRTAQHKPMAKWGTEYLARYVHDDHALGGCYADVYGEYIVVWAALLLLTASRPIVNYSHVDLTKLNKHRKAKGRSLLLDHTVVSLRLSDNVTWRGQGVPLGHARKSPRVHMVSSYLARRGDKHWVVAPYFRGSGDTIHRVTRVKG